MQGKVIGIVGGGQLERMTTLAAKPLGFRVIVVDTKPDSPAAQVGAEEIIASSGSDEAALNKLARQADYLTVQFEEQFDIQLLEKVATSGKSINPSPQTIKLIKDKLKQKEFLRAHKIAVGPFAEITDAEQAKKLLKQFGGKMVVKTREGGYDGNGNAVVTNPTELLQALERFKDRPLYGEAFIPFSKELAVMIARDITGNLAVYPVVQTIHVRNICDEVLVPAPATKAVHDKARALALQVATHLKGAGVFGVEMFLTKNGEVLVNEIAPRVHNSGHYTIEACVTSQFEQHVRAITGLPLGSTELVVPAAVMINILGERNGKTKITGLAEALSITGVSVHLYDKSPTKVDRKMGHITAIGDTLDIALERAREARKRINI